MVWMADSFVLGGGAPPRLCLRNNSDPVSDAIRRKGAWKDCAILSLLWASWLAEPAQQNFSAFVPCSGFGGRKLFVDVGANIGACSLQMLARPDVRHVVAFEPNPENLFYFTSSVLANAEFRSKLTLYPAALGSSHGECCLFVERANPGNTAVGARIQRRMRGAPATVETLTLDEVFLPQGRAPPYIHLMKIDAQGFEVKILRGAARLLASGALNAVLFEFARLWLRWQGDEPVELFSLLYTSGYDIYKDDGIMVPLTPGALRGYACPLGHYMADFFAVRNRFEAAVQRRQRITC